jgi:hypothetical protein
MITFIDDTSSRIAAWEKFQQVSGINDITRHQFTLHVQACLDMCAQDRGDYSMEQGNRVIFTDGFQIMRTQVDSMLAAGMLKVTDRKCEITDTGRGMLVYLNEEFGPVTVARTAGCKLPEVFRPSPSLR